MLVNNLSFQHSKNSPYFFRDLTFKLEQGKMHALHGKNGMGKSVLLNILSKRCSPEAVIKGKIVGGDKIVLVNQRFDQMITDNFTFTENFQFACKSRFPSAVSGLKRSGFYAVMVFEFLKTLLVNNMTLLVVCHDRDLVKKYTTGLDMDGLRRVR